MPKRYVLAGILAADKVGNNNDLLLSKAIPLSEILLLSNTPSQATQPDTQNNTAGFLRKLRIFSFRWVRVSLGLTGAGHIHAFR
jgi:hypothetical protein